LYVELKRIILEEVAVEGEETFDPRAEVKILVYGDLEDVEEGTEGTEIIHGLIIIHHLIL
jgi:hypothetical protein